MKEKNNNFLDSLLHFGSPLVITLAVFGIVYFIVSGIVALATPKPGADIDLSKVATGAIPPASRTLPTDPSAETSEDPDETTPGSTTPAKPDPGPVVTTVDDRYFEDALFIGDSRTDGLRLYSPIPGADYYCGTSMNIFKVMDSDFTTAGYKGLQNLLKNKQYGKIYIMFGINEAGYDTDIFAAQYRSVIEQIRSSQPDALIYIQSILYVTQEHEKKNPVFSTENLKGKNEKLAQMANGVDIFYLEVNDALNDGTDHLPSNYTGDGVHLYGNYYSLWRDYLMEHAIVDVFHPWSPESEPETGTPEE